MSNKKNKEIEVHDSESEEEQPSGDEKDPDFDSDGNYIGDKEDLMADFEGRNPEDCDFHGIKQLLRQLFLKANVDLGGLAQIIISQNYVGSVVKQCLDDGLDDLDDDEDDGSDGVFGVTTVINITKRKEENCIQQIRTLLTTLAEENADDRTKSLIKNILSNDQQHVGLVLNERILNIPAAISVPLFASLQSEIDKAVQKNMPYTFQYIIWICKTYSSEDEPGELLYANMEESRLSEEALASFDVNVTDQTDLSQWDYEGGTLTPFRKILIIEGNKFNGLVRQMKEEVEHAVGEQKSN
ncbi:protein BCCIP homolog [Spodoptera litura]|uniref:Protein BCCIP homolog n=1 Tax=Spodoptera litura TaxID=69820 RepID=A0A9J7EB78_SPOLT|nr:protein BCCIP homolog [Spodoptera litura]